MDDLLQQRQGEDEPQKQHKDGEGDLRVAGPRLDPEQRDAEGDAGKSGEDGEDGDAAFVDQSVRFELLAGTVGHVAGNRCPS